MDLQLDGRRALVTGAAIGIGGATAEHLAAGKLAGSVIAVSADLSNAAGCSEGATQAVEALGVLDILMNSVGSGAGRTDITMTTASRAQTIAARGVAS